MKYAGTRLAIIIQSSAPIFVTLFLRTKNRSMTARVSMTPNAMVQRTTVSPRGLGVGDMIRKVLVNELVSFLNYVEYVTLLLIWEGTQFSKHKKFHERESLDEETVSSYTPVVTRSSKKIENIGCFSVFKGYSIYFDPCRTLCWDWMLHLRYSSVNSPVGGPSCFW